jgi:putative membrane protein
MLMSEWPKGGALGPAGWRKLLDAWRSPAFGLLTFILSGLLGFLLLYRSPVSPEVAFQNLMPGFVGLFTVPWLILNVASRLDIPPQRLPRTLGLDRAALLQGTAAGTLGGAFAAFFPVVTGGVGGFLAGHATALRNDRAFLFSQGASKLVYYVGGFLLFFVPGLNVTRGGAAWMLRGLYVPHSSRDFFLALAAAAIAGAVSCLLAGPLTRAVVRRVSHSGYRQASWAALVLAVGIVWAITGLPGLLVLAVSSGIGLIPVLFGSRRMNCLGVILLPMACNMSGVGVTIAEGLGLL